MSRSPTFVRALGYLALALFLGMAVVLRFVIGPDVSFTPQAEIGRYSDADLVALGAELRETGQAGLYKFILLGVDFVFITVFGLWVMLVHAIRGLGPVRWVGVALACAFMALDYGEDLMLAIRMGLATKGNLDPAVLTNPVSLVHYVTLAKFAVFALCMLSVYFVSRRRA
ncbi:hypothetical protein [Planktotalea sp.]|uniref:hypothetical protein n=1 Tax=Planktotalea sp. TaxID=2029877 RepID=UPI0032969AD9